MIQKKLIAVFLLIGMHSFAQLNKNKIMISGRGNYFEDNIQQDVNDITNSHFKNKISDGALNLNIGYFLSNNFIIGGIAGFGKSMQFQNNIYISGDNSSRKITTQNFSSGVFARYNHMIKESQFGLFFQLNNTYTWGRIDGEYTYTSINFPLSGYVDLKKYRAYDVVLTPGLMYFINNKLSIETSIGNLSYNSSVTKDRPLELSVEKTSRFNTDFSMATVYFGLTFYMGGKKSETAKTEPSGN
jgi:hypothetical protein